MVAINGLSHITLAVADLDRSLAFYRDVLGCRVRAIWADGAYLDAGRLWLCLSRDPIAEARTRRDYSHIAFSVREADYATMRDRLTAQCIIWKQNKSEGPSTYFVDPDGHRLEIHLGTLETRLSHYRNNPFEGLIIVE